MVARIDAVVQQAKLAGEVLVAKGDIVLLDKGYGTIAPDGGALHHAGARWRLASITKQVAAALLLQANPGQLDTPDAGDALTLRHLLTHHTGLANPDDTPAAAADAVPGFYAKPSPDLAYCATKPAGPGADFAYNNCDYLVAWQRYGGAALRWPAGTALARPGDRLVPGYVRGKPEPAFALATWGAAGGLIGTARSVFAFDRSLMTGKLLPPAALAELWKPEGNGSYQALGQWVFPGNLKGCAKPKRIVQRDGEIYGVQARNFILPDDNLVVIVFTNRSSDDFAMGEVWQGKGFTYNLLSVVACP